MTENERQERKLAEINQQRVLAVAWNAIRPFLDAQRIAAVGAVTGAFRAGKSPQELQALVARLSAVEDLEIMIQTQLKRNLEDKNYA